MLIQYEARFRDYSTKRIIWKTRDNTGTRGKPREGANTIVMLLKTVQQLRIEMMNLRADKEKWWLEQENIMKIISDKQNQ